MAFDLERLATFADRPARSMALHIYRAPAADTAAEVLADGYFDAAPAGLIRQYDVMMLMKKQADGDVVAKHVVVKTEMTTHGQVRLKLVDVV